MSLSGLFCRWTRRRRVSRSSARNVDQEAHHDFCPSIELLEPRRLLTVACDLNADNKINFADLAYFAAEFLKYVDAPDATALTIQADFDCSRRVDFADFSWFALNFLREPENVILPPCQPQAPVARDDDVSTDEDTVLNGNVFIDNGRGADVDHNGDPLTVIEVNGKSGDVGTRITLPSGASLTVNDDGSFEYDPRGLFDSVPPGGWTTDTFAYTISDGHTGNDSATVTMTINGVNDAPVLTPTNPHAGNTDEDTPRDFNLEGLATVSDPDLGAILGGIAVMGVSGNGTLSYKLTGGPSFVDVVSPSPQAAVLLPDTAELRYTPDGLNGETVDIVFRGWDQTSGDPGEIVDATTFGGSTALSAASDAITLTVSDVNDDPVVANPIVELHYDEGDGTPVDFYGDADPDAYDVAPIDLLDTPWLDGVFTDPDLGDTMTFSVVGNTNPGNGDPDDRGLVQATVVGSELQIRYFAYKEEQDRTPAVVTLRATDATGAHVDHQFTVTVTPINTVNVVLIPVMQPTSDFDVFVAYPSLADIDPLGSVRAMLVDGDLWYSLMVSSGLYGVDLPGDDDYGDGADDITAIAFCENSDPDTPIFNVLTDDDVEIDTVAGNVIGVWETGAERLEDFLDQLKAGEIYVQVTIDGVTTKKVGARNLSATPEVTSLPDNLVTSVVEGQKYWVEVWVQDTLDWSTGLTIVGQQTAFDTALSQGNENNIIYDDLFETLPWADVDNDRGIVSSEGRTIFPFVGLDPAWARACAVEFTAIGAGDQNYTVTTYAMDRQNGPFIDASQMTLTGAIVEHVAADISGGRSRQIGVTAPDWRAETGNSSMANLNFARSGLSVLPANVNHTLQIDSSKLDLMKFDDRDTAVSSSVGGESDGSRPAEMGQETENLELALQIRFVTEVTLSNPPIQFAFEGDF